jgi:SAM-dependent methyltransferase
MVAAARDADPEIEVHLADAAQLPLPDGAFDCAAAFMSLQDVDDLGGFVREAARVLEPGGRLCLAVVHPLNSAGLFRGEMPESPFVVDGSYLDESYYQDEIERRGLALTLVSAHRPLQSYTEALADAGFAIERLREPAIPADAYAEDRSRRWLRIPLFLYIRAVRAGG